ncbi:hypothetical protein [Microbacterium sp. MPKO10]|uniref:hypothetical protein n=1 Tax=Microbacterium sp. MPKO10 TaxID=2989818 RepID=UPI002236AC0A|nr:hypothetical protein [Microbacterium sp. MPKO10]MCW4456663.1 hypothetical protein [Microbacterium sp. MPKO10]
MARLQIVLGGLPDALPGYRFTPGGAPSPHQSIAENVMLGHEPTRFGLIRRRELEAQAIECLDAVGWRGDVRAPANTLDVVDARLVQLARAVALARQGEEPAVLVDDTHEELVLADSIRWQHALVEASRRIPLVVALTTLDGLHPDVDEVLVADHERLRGPFEPTDAAGLSAALGISDSIAPVTSRPAGDVLLDVREVTVRHPVRADRPVFENISFEARAGRVLALAGTHAHELLASLSGRGYGEIVSGSVTVAGTDIVGLSREAALEHGAVFTTEHPLSYEVGFIGGLPSRVSAERLRTLSRTGVIDAGREYRPVSTASLLQAVGVGRPPSRDQFEGMLESLVTGPARVVLIAEPLLGLGPDDRAARIELVSRIAGAGAAVVISAGPHDAAALADGALAVVHGRVRAALAAGDLTGPRLERILTL